MLDVLREVLTSFRHGHAYDITTAHSIAVAFDILERASTSFPLLRLKFSPQLPFGFKPVSNIVAVLTAARDVDLKCAVGNLDVGWLPFQ